MGDTFYVGILTFHCRIESVGINLKNRVRDIRKQRNLSQTQLEEIANIGRTTISNIETERYTPRVDVAMQLAQALGCTVEDLFMLEERR